MDFIFWFVAVFALLYGILLLALPKARLAPVLEKQLIQKGNSNPTEEDIAKKLKQFRIYGVVCLAASGVLTALLLTGGIF